MINNVDSHKWIIKIVKWYFPQCGKSKLNVPHCKNYNVDFPLCVKNGIFSTKFEVEWFIFYNMHRKWNKKSTHNVKSGKFVNKTSTVK